MASYLEYLIDRPIGTKVSYNPKNIPGTDWAAVNAATAAALAQVKMPEVITSKSEWEMQQEYEETKNRANAFDIARELARQYGLGESIANTVIDMIVNKGYTNEAVKSALYSTPEFKERFSGIEKYKQKYATDIAANRKALAPTPEQYITLEQDYQFTLNRYGLGDLATRQNFAELVANDVSPYELQNRIGKAYDKVKNADDLLKQELRTYFPTLDSSDFARALLTSDSPENMAAQLERKVKRAEIGSEMTRFGFRPSMTTAQELETLGVTREAARTGFGKIAEQLQPTEKLAQIYEGTAAGIQEELTAEQFKGLQSQRRKRLEEQEKATFAGSSGVSTVSLGTSGMGTF